MTISIWRYSHLVLALVSSLFLLVAAVTGVILAVEPITYQTKGYAVHDLEDVPLGVAINALKQNYDEVLGLEVESSGFVKAQVLTMDLETLDIYIDPKTGGKLGEVEERPYIYTFATNLHRSLFLKSVGRFFVGLISLLLFIIVVTGLVLLAKRQGGFKKIFNKVQKDYFELRYHVILSRWFLIPIIILSITGVYLSAEKFDLLPDSIEVPQEMDVDHSAEVFADIQDVPFFKETTLDDVRQVEFPFSDDPEDYYRIALSDREIQVNQQTGAIVTSINYPFTVLASRLSLVLHTGEGNVLWSIILLLASASILFFMYSGFVMTLKRRKKGKVSIKMPNKDECEYIILVGSETGTTFDFAQRFYDGLSKTGKKVYLAELNKYTTYARATHMIICTATYGEGEPPTNARKFSTLFSNIKQPNTISYAVIGFGSLEYPDYCKFAIQIDALLQADSNFTPVMPLCKVDSANHETLANWVDQWGNRQGLKISLEHTYIKEVERVKIPFELTERTGLNVDDTFLLKFRPKQKITFTSGDLLAVFPDESGLVRQYSIAKINDEVLLSVKKHEMGRGSNYLYALEVGDVIEAAIDVNAHFHFPEKSAMAILIANGTGIAPFLGMLQHTRQKQIALFWGGRTRNSSLIYENFLNGIITTNEKISFMPCFSREDEKRYVQDLVREQQNVVLHTLTNDGTVMICGSLAMQHEVLDVLETILIENTTLTIEELQNKGLIKTDCY
ncbi:sulfite reductase (NADPH) flavoprotein alpha-component [Maribacter sedimenticola]|uniref:Methionine synthase reductase n=1 Tax=Maribacter sedimenticola TaxID=228956 RepID=A0ABY1SJJ1_9FLAO|nr:PepSY domain-containing protein [Maribacter sedimenticola]SNR64822.1 sulfite reductase (NADPH) flavoprotein alpha-component [Maribacter sedimenticola]